MIGFLSRWLGGAHIFVARIKGGKGCSDFCHGENRIIKFQIQGGAPIFVTPTICSARKGGGARILSCVKHEMMLASN